MNKYDNLAILQLLVTPFRAETKNLSSLIPIYSQVNPIIPPYMLSRPIYGVPISPSFRQVKELLSIDLEKKVTGNVLEK